MIVLVVLYNIVVLLAFAELSMHFETWWIMLFAILFIRDMKIQVIEEDNDNE